VALRKQFFPQATKFKVADSRVETVNDMKALLNKYPRSWCMQIGRKIKYSQGWEDLKVQIYFWSDNMFYPVVVSKV